MGCDLSRGVLGEARKWCKATLGGLGEATQAIGDQADWAANAADTQYGMHECTAHRSTLEWDAGQRERPSTFHEESAGSGTLTVCSAPGRKVWVQTIVPTLHFGQLALHTAALVVSETAWGWGCSAATAGISDLQSSRLPRRDALASKP